MAGFALTLEERENQVRTVLLIIVEALPAGAQLK